MFYLSPSQEGRGFGQQGNKCRDEEAVVVSRDLVRTPPPPHVHFTRVRTRVAMERRHKFNDHSSLRLSEIATLFGLLRIHSQNRP